MKKQTILNLLVLTGTLAFNFLFWQEKMGINLLIFTLFMMGGLHWLHEQKSYSLGTLITAASTISMALMVVLHNSLMSKIMYSFSFTAMVGMAHQQAIRFFFYGILQGILDMGSMPKKLVQQFSGWGLTIANIQKSWKYTRVSVVPVLVLFIFFTIYYAANPKFALFSDSAWEGLSHFFSWNISPARVLFFITGLFLVGGTLWKSNFFDLAELSTQHSEQLFRRNRKKADPAHHRVWSMLALKDEYRVALLMMVMLNLLLLVVNSIDVVYVWFNFEEQPAYSLKNYVHEGTYLLITSILLAMSIIVFYFRGNLNFYKKNQFLKNLTYAWIIQNGVLCFSVFMRNYKYIDYHGLAYKRIGVMIFLIAVIYGLFTMYQKVKDQRSFYFLLNRNIWGVFILLILASTINWDVFITRYNITVETKRPIDVKFLAKDVSDKNLFLLCEYEDQLTPNYEYQQVTQMIRHKRRGFETSQAKYSWLSWNYSDYRNRKYLEEKGL